MPRIAKTLPQDRAAYSFGDLVYWHLFRFGTRPSGDPSAKAGRVWEIDAICTLLDINPRTLRNWIADKHLPDTITPLSNELFGNNSGWDEARAELQAKFEQGWAAKRQGRSGTPQAPEPNAKPAGLDKVPDNAASSAEAGGGGSQEKQEGVTTGQALRPVQPDRLRPQDTTRRAPTRKTAAAYVALAAIVGGTFAWLHLTRKSDIPSPAPPKVVATVPPPKAAPPSPKIGEATPDRPKTDPMGPLGPSMAPAPTPLPESKQAVPVKPPAPTEQELRAAEEKLFLEKMIAARKAQHEREIREQEDRARKLDADLQSGAGRQRRIEDDARTVAGIGYRLRENTGVAGSSFRHGLTSTVADCALFCVEHGCDAFSWYRDQFPEGSPRPRYCYLYKRPFDINNYPGFTLGQPTPDPLVKSSFAPTPEKRIRLAQAGPPKEVPAQADDLTRCAGGPVKVTGFKLTCDRILDGGTIVGSAQLRHVVPNINECAAKCRPHARCVGFTFNSGDPPGRHACTIFGPTPESRDAKGWISGVR